MAVKDGKPFPTPYTSQHGSTHLNFPNSSTEEYRLRLSANPAETLMSLLPSLMWLLPYDDVDNKGDYASCLWIKSNRGCPILISIYNNRYSDNDRIRSTSRIQADDDRNTPLRTYMCCFSLRPDNSSSENNARFLVMGSCNPG